MFIEVRLLQPDNAFIGIDFIELDKVISRSEEQPEKADLSIEVTLLGTSKSIREEQAAFL